MKYLFLLPGFLLTSFSPPAKKADCGCGEIKGNHDRIKLKDRIPPASVKTEDASIDDLISKWPIPYTITKDDPNEYDNEKKLYKIEGYLQLIKIEDNDCDIHMEISADQSGNQDRIIAEIPNTKEYCALHKEIMDEVKKLVKKEVSTTPIKFLKQGLQVHKIIISGYGFLDTSHKIKTPASLPSDPKKKKAFDKKFRKGNKHGSADVMTLWEIHPVVDYSIK